MAIVIMLIIAFWFLSNAGMIPVALAVCMTVFGSLHCLFRLIGFIIKVYKKYEEDNRPCKTGFKELDRFL